MFADTLATTDAELLRRADLIDLSACVLRLGVPRAEIRDLFRRVPRTGFYGEILRLAARVLRERPSTLPRTFLHRGGT